MARQHFWQDNAPSGGKIRRQDKQGNSYTETFSIEKGANDDEKKSNYS